MKNSLWNSGNLNDQPLFSLLTIVLLSIFLQLFVLGKCINYDTLYLSWAGNCHEFNDTIKQVIIKWISNGNVHIKGKYGISESQNCGTLISNVFVTNIQYSVYQNKGKRVKCEIFV